jgi:hypothetical protein
MILFGRKAHHLGLTNAKDIKCEKCGKCDVVISAFQKYFHILWLPMFPIKKDCASQCLNCQNIMVERKFSAEVKKLASKLKKQYSTPFWSFSGIFLGLLILLIKSMF